MICKRETVILSFLTYWCNMRYTTMCKSRKTFGSIPINRISSDHKMSRAFISYVAYRRHDRGLTEIVCARARVDTPNC